MAASLLSDEKQGDMKLYLGGYQVKPMKKEVKAPRCERCRALLVKIHCKLECKQCGFRYDCSDVANLEIE